MMRLGVLVYIEKDEQVLMIHRQKRDEHQGFWLAPGGKIEANEPPHEAARREVIEETGLELTNLHLQGLLSFRILEILPLGMNGTFLSFIRTVFRVPCEKIVQKAPLPGFLRKS